MERRLIECVPNFSEGRDEKKIKLITDVIEASEGVRLLNVDPGKATNRTVVTFVGEPEAVIEAAFRAISKAAEVIDMRKHSGEHPRMGATDVCPLIPISGVTMEQTAALAHRLGERVGKELKIPVYFYEKAAKKKDRANLANCRSGEYEGLERKFKDPEWNPDAGPDKFDSHVASTGATAVGARDFLVAYNINLNTTSVRRANSVAYDIREKGRIKRSGNPITGEVEKDAQGNPVWESGSLKSVKGIGWFIEEYGIAQVSLNLTNISITPIHTAFDEACKKATQRGLRVTGSELIGLVPLSAMLDAGKYFLQKQKLSCGVAEDQLISIAVKSLGLDELTPFKPRERIIEYLLEDAGYNRLAAMTLTAFANETASESPAPGGGSIAAYVGSLGVALGTMVANLSASKRGWDDRWEEFSMVAEKGQQLKDKLLHLVDEDTRAFNHIMEAFGLPKSNDTETAGRKKAIQDATKYAMEVPYEVIRLSLEGMSLCKSMAENGNPNSVSDAGVGAACCRAAALGALLNVKINAAGLDDKVFAKKLIKEAELGYQSAVVREQEVLDIAERIIAGNNA